MTLNNIKSLVFNDILYLQLKYLEQIYANIRLDYLNSIFI